MKNKENAKAIENLREQSIDADQVKGGGSGEINIQTLKGRQSPHAKNPMDKPMRRPGKEGRTPQDPSAKV